MVLNSVIQELLKVGLVAKIPTELIATNESW